MCLDIRSETYTRQYFNKYKISVETYCPNWGCSLPHEKATQRVILLRNLLTSCLFDLLHHNQHSYRSCSSNRTKLGQHLLPGAWSVHTILCDSKRLLYMSKWAPVLTAVSGSQPLKQQSYCHISGVINGYILLQLCCYISMKPRKYARTTLFTHLNYNKSLKAFEKS